MGGAAPGGQPHWPLSPAEQRLLDAADRLSAAIEGQLTAAQPPELHRAAEPALIGAFHAVRAVRCLRAATLTSRAGYAVEAAPIVRSLLEDAVSLRYLSARPTHRVRKWLRFDEQRSLEYWKLIERLGLDLQKSDHIRHLEQASHPSGSPVWWSNKTPSAMARELRDTDPDLVQTFKAFYPWLSDVAHANVKTTSNYYFAEEGAEPELRVGPSDHLLHLMLELATALAVRICFIARELGTGMDPGPIAEAHRDFEVALGEG